MISFPYYLIIYISYLLPFSDKLFTTNPSPSFVLIGLPGNKSCYIFGKISDIDVFLAISFLM